MKKQPIAHHYYTDADGRRLVRLCVHGSDAPVVTEAALWNNAQRLFGLTGRLYMSSDGKGHSYVLAAIPGAGSHRPLARLLLINPGGYRVRYIDKNPLNMLAENLRLDAPWADHGTAAKALALLLDNARHGWNQSGRSVG